MEKRYCNRPDWANPRVVTAGLVVLGLLGCRPATHMPDPLTPIAESYVRLVLAVGVHDPDYVDAYYGPPLWKAEADSVKLGLGEIRARAARLLDSLNAVALPDTAELVRLRQRYLTLQLQALAARLDMLEGQRLGFDQESRALYAAVAPTHDESHFQAVLARLDGLLPGRGPVPARYEAFRRSYVIPPERVDTVFKTAIASCRERTLRHISLPAGEQFTLEYVKDKPWSGYNWYQGSNRSLIQVNTDLPIYIDRALDLACHEGYPGHHVYNVMLEQALVRERGWPEYQVYPLFSPQSLIAEGTANFGIDIAFPGTERLTFERDVLYPLAGLDPASAATYAEVQAVVEDLSYAGNEAARRYLEGRIDAAAAADWLVRFALMSPDRAAQRVRFFDRYRSYVINYNVGRDLVARYVERESGAGATPEARWRVFAALLASPRLPPDLEARRTVNGEQGTGNGEQGTVNRER